MQKIWQVVVGFGIIDKTTTFFLFQTDFSSFEEKTSTPPVSTTLNKNNKKSGSLLNLV